MNKNFYEYAKSLIKNTTVDELEKKLVAFGFDVQRKVPLYSSSELFGAIFDAPLNTLLEAQVVFDPTVGVVYAANDNSYALAA